MALTLLNLVGMETPKVSSRNERQVAPRKKDPYLSIEHMIGAIPFDDPVLNTEAQKAGQNYQYPFGMYREAFDRDPMVVACLQQRKSSILSRNRVIHPSAKGNETKAKKSAELIQAWIEYLDTSNADGGFQKLLFDTMGAIPYGVSYQELIWDNFVPLVMKSGVSNWRVPARTVDVDPRMIEYNSDNEMMVITNDDPTGQVVSPTRFIVFRPQGTYDDPYGYPALRPVWWYTWYKRCVMAFWAQYNESYGTPIPYLIPEHGLNEAEENVVLDFFDNIMQTTGLLASPGSKVGTLESAASRSETFLSFLEYCDQQIAIALIGSVLTVTSGTGDGTKSMSEVHERVSMGIQAMDARALESAINSTVIPMIINSNLPGYPMPRLEIITAPPKNIQQIVETATALAGTDYDVSILGLEDETGIKRADNDDDVLHILETGPTEQLANPNQAKTNPGRDRSARTTNKRNQKQRERTKKKPGPGEPRPLPKKSDEDD